MSGAATADGAAEPVAPAAQPVRLVQNSRGLLLMVGAMALFAAVDTQAKFLTDTLHPVQIVWARHSGLLVGVLVLLLLKGPSLLKSRLPALQMARGALAATSPVLFIAGIAYVPLADAVAVSFVAPFIVTILGALLLGERVGMRRWVAVAIGFLGAMIVIRPGLGAIHPAAFLVVLAASLFAVRQVLSRFLTGADSTATTVAYTALTGSALLTLPLPFVWRWPETTLEITLLISIAVMAACAEILVIKALELAEAVVVAPVQYTLLIWGVMYGFLVFGQLPDGWTTVGALLIVASGLYVFHRERVAARERAKPTP